MENLMIWISFMIYVWFIVSVVAILVFLLVLGRREYRGYVDIFAKEEAKTAKKARKSKEV